MRFDRAAEAENSNWFKLALALLLKAHFDLSNWQRFGTNGASLTLSVSRSCQSLPPSVCALTTAEGWQHRPGRFSENRQDRQRGVFRRSKVLPGIDYQCRKYRFYVAGLGRPAYKHAENSGFHGRFNRKIGPVIVINMSVSDHHARIGELLRWPVAALSDLPRSYTHC